MSINHEEDHDDGIAGSTIIMVDTFDDSFEQEDDSDHGNLLEHVDGISCLNFAIMWLLNCSIKLY